MVGTGQTDGRSATFDLPDTSVLWPSPSNDCNFTER